MDENYYFAPPTLRGKQRLWGGLSLSWTPGSARLCHWLCVLVQVTLRTLSHHWHGKYKSTGFLWELHLIFIKALAGLKNTCSLQSVVHFLESLITPGIRSLCYNIKVKLALSPPLYYVVKMFSILEMRLMHVIISGCCYLLLLKFSFSASHFASCLWLHFYFAVYYRTASLSLCYRKYCQL